MKVKHFSWVVENTRDKEILLLPPCQSRPDSIILVPSTSQKQSLAVLQVSFVHKKKCNIQPLLPLFKANSTPVTQSELKIRKNDHELM